MLAMYESECWQKAGDALRRGNAEQAIEICEAAPCRDVMECQHFLGNTHYGRDELDEALSWFRKAAAQGYAEAVFGIAAVHAKQCDYEQALEHFKMASDMGSAKGLAWAGYFYHHGLGVPADLNTAIFYYEKAAAAGYLLAERALVHLAFQQGSLVAKLRAIPRFIRILAKAWSIALQDPNDERVRDIPKWDGPKWLKRLQASPPRRRERQ